MESYDKPCCLCGNTIHPDPDGWNGTNNPEPLYPFKAGRCCNRCNGAFVIRARCLGARLNEEIVERFIAAAAWIGAAERQLDLAIDQLYQGGE